ncbi:MAG: ANTAR domain-containing protein [Streptosporangiales bacterium]|nr:ANTAR domain-containing protein [Streptosporangiales bacterium]
MRERELAETFAELAGTLTADFDIIDFLHRVAARCVEVLGVDAAGLLLIDSQGGLRLAAASTERARVLELLQSQDEEGPGLDCHRLGGPVGSADLRSEHERWPRFAPAARDAGFLAVQALPMRLRDEVIGAVNLFSARAGLPGEDVLRVGQAMADVASVGILHERVIRHGELLAEQLQMTLHSRTVLEQAKGALAEHRGIGVDAAFGLMLGFAHERRMALSDVARAVIRAAPEVTDLLSEPEHRPG